MPKVPWAFASRVCVHSGVGMKTMYLVMDCDHPMCIYPTEAAAEAHLSALRAYWVKVESALADTGSVREVPIFEDFSTRDFHTLEILYQSQYLPDAETAMSLRGAP